MAARFRVQGTGYTVLGARYKVQGTRYKVQGTRYRVQGMYKVQDHLDQSTCAARWVILSLRCFCMRTVNTLPGCLEPDCHPRNRGGKALHWSAWHWPTTSCKAEALNACDLSHACVIGKTNPDKSAGAAVLQPCVLQSSLLQPCVLQPSLGYNRTHKLSQVSCFQFVAQQTMQRK